LIFETHLPFLHLSSLNKYLTVKIDDVKAAAELFYQSNARSNERKATERERLRMEVQGDLEDVVDVDDIKKRFEEKGHGRHLLEMEFEPTTEKALDPYPSTRTGRMTTKWTWRHKLTNDLVHRYKTQSGKSFDTGVLSQYLQSLRETTYKVAFERAKLILRLNGSKKKGVDASTKGPVRVVDRESLLKQWVSACFVVACMFFGMCLTYTSVPFFHFLITKGSCDSILYRGQLRHSLPPRPVCQSIFSMP
jgi:hypothetical protein